MVELHRKRKKAAPEVLLSKESQEESADRRQQECVQFIPWSGQGFRDMTEFATGVESVAIQNRARWNGPFSGRPTLISEIGAHLQATYGQSPRSVWAAIRSALRTFWRLLDQCDDFAPVQCVADLNDVHGALQFREGVIAECTNYFLYGANAERVRQGLSKLYWPRTERQSKTKDLPAIEHIKPLYHELSHRIRDMMRRWDSADREAETGQDMLVHVRAGRRIREWADGDLYATYRAIGKELNHPCPSMETVKRVVDMQYSRLQSAFFEVVFAHYPSREDIQNLFMLFLIKTGWNAATAIRLDISSEEKWFRRHPTSPEHHIIYGIKRRGSRRTEQVAIGLNKSQLSAGNLIRALVDRTEPLRNHLTQELADLMEKKSKSEADVSRIEELHVLIASPWLFVSSRNHNKISALTIDDHTVTGSGRLSMIKQLIRDVNCSLSKEKQIPESIRLTEVRDVFISFAYSNSGFSWLVAQLAAGHSSVETLRSYLRRFRWKLHGEKKTRSFLDALWTEIEKRRVVDPAILYAMVERGEISEEQRQRWMRFKDRTRIGTGCKDFFRPPKEIAPNHKEGEGCRSQRCTLCHYGIVFADSVDFLARRLAELKKLKQDIPLATWHSSSFPLEELATEKTLQLFDAQEVAARLSYWQAEIASGAHTPFEFEGEYGTAI